MMRARQGTTEAVNEMEPFGPFRRACRYARLAVILPSTYDVTQLIQQWAAASAPKDLVAAAVGVTRTSRICLYLAMSFGMILYPV